jgi:hypothetical protein
MKMTEKNIGFNRNIRLAWLDAAAAFCGESDDSAEIRARLEPVVGQDIASDVNRRKAIDILINIWVKTGESAPELRQQAVNFFRATPVVADRLWVHYGLTLVYSPFFREVAAAIGKVTRHGDAVTPSMVKQRLIAERGQLGSLEKAVERVIFSLRDWGLLADAPVRYAYRSERQSLNASSAELESWLLACVLQAHPAEEIVFGDLVRLPELFAFRFTVTLDHLRRSRDFEVQRQGAGWDMVRFAPHQTPHRLAMTSTWAD